MELLEYIEKLDADTYIKVGADKGNGFLYCGKAGDFLDFFTEAKPNEKEVDRLNTAINIKQVYVSNFEKNWSNKIDRLVEEYKKNKKEGKKDRRFKPYNNLRAYKRHLQKEKEKDYKTAVNSIATNEQRLSSFTPIESREIVSTYESILLNEDKKRDHIIIFKGKEAYTCWDLTEFRHGVSIEDMGA